MLERPALRWSVLGAILACFTLTNLPWTLDDYDQAKQAYTSFEMVGQGHWLYQHTPKEGVATKPPLVGWISAGLFVATRWWEGAWRLPSLGAALGLLWLIGRAAARAYGATAGFIALGAFGLNLLAPRLATLVRTDMPLALLTFLIGAQIWEKIRRAETWTARDRWLAFALLTAALWIKGPIIYAFLLPGLIAWQILRRRRGGTSAWCGWWPWLWSLALFLAWAIGGIVRQPEFYDAVVLKEFAGRFSETVHRPQPFYFYLPHLLHKFAPWSLLLVGFGVVFWRERRAQKISPATLWLVCWSVGGLLLMSVIPSKRVDRIFPILPPLCLLLGAQIFALRERVWLRLWLQRALFFSVVFTIGYAAWKIGSAERENAGALVRFGREVRERTQEKQLRYAVVGGREEGLLLYLRRDHFLAPKNAAQLWNDGALDALVLPRGEPRGLFAGADEALLSEKSSAVPQYVLLVRQNLARQPDAGR